MPEKLTKSLEKELTNYHLKDHTFFTRLIFTIKRLEKRMEELEKELKITKNLP
jgi:hypothetical protein